MASRETGRGQRNRAAVGTCSISGLAVESRVLKRPFMRESASQLMLEANRKYASTSHEDVDVEGNSSQLLVAAPFWDEGCESVAKHRTTAHRTGSLFRLDPGE